MRRLDRVCEDHAVISGVGNTARQRSRVVDAPAFYIRCRDRRCTSPKSSAHPAHRGLSAQRYARYPSLKRHQTDKVIQCGTLSDSRDAVFELLMRFAERSTMRQRRRRRNPTQSKLYEHALYKGPGADHPKAVLGYYGVTRRTCHSNRPVPTSLSPRTSSITPHEETLGDRCQPPCQHRRLRGLCAALRLRI